MLVIFFWIPILAFNLYSHLLRALSFLIPGWWGKKEANMVREREREKILGINFTFDDAFLWGHLLHWTVKWIARVFKGRNFNEHIKKLEILTEAFLTWVCQVLHHLFIKSFAFSVQLKSFNGVQLNSELRVLLRLFLFLLLLSRNCCFYSLSSDPSRRISFTNNIKIN